MSRSHGFPADTQVQKFLEESYNKERDTHLRWYFKKAADPQGQKSTSKQFDVFRKKVEAACPKPTQGLLELQNMKPKNYHRRVRTYNDLPQRTQSASITDMVPPQTSTKTLLYDGFSMEGKGRQQYLQSRYEERPESKYHFPILSSWEYGWRLDDVIKPGDIKTPARGRTRLVKDTFYTRTGIPTLQSTN